jgi:FkbM family methyltransferase
VRKLAALRPTTGSLSSLARSARPRTAAEKIRNRIEWLRFARLVPVSANGPVVWLGSGYGGYVVPDGVVSSDWICYSAGLGEDITFELELIRRHGCSVFAFDPTPGAVAHVEPIAETTPHLHFLPYALWTDDSTQRFYKPREEAHVSHSLANLQGTMSYIDVPCRSIPSLMAELGHDRVDLLKLDIEGAEYDVLDSLLETAVRPQVLCVDFHRVESVEAMAAGVRRLCASGYRPVHVYRTDVTLVAEP